MNRDFNLKYDQIKDNQRSINQNELVPISGSSNASYSETGHIRNVCFVDQNRRRLFLSYSYLIAGEFVPEDNLIILSYTSHTITLKGIYLEGLFYDFMQQLVKQIVCINPRYNNLDEANNQFTINQIQVVKNAP